MSFVNITDINKRDEIVKKFLSLQKQIQTRDRMEKMGEIGRDEGLSKFFKPVTTGTEQLGKKLTEEIGKIAKPETGAVPPPPIDEEDEAKKYNIYDDPEINKYFNKIEQNDTIYIKYGKKEPIFLMGVHPLNVTKNKIEYMGKEYERTPELLDLIFSVRPPINSKIHHPQAYSDFKDMMRDADILLEPGERKEMIFNKDIKRTNKRWSNLLGVVADDLILEHRNKVRKEETKQRGEKIRKIKEKQTKKSKRQQDPTDGKGILDTAVKLIKKHHQAENKAREKQGKGQKTIILSSDPLALADRLSLLCGSVKAGNTGLKNEIVEVCNELIRKKLMSRKERDELLNTV